MRSSRLPAATGSLSGRLLKIIFGPPGSGFDFYGKPDSKAIIFALPFEPAWQSPRAAEQDSSSLASGEKTCIDGHKGIAHHLPDLKGVEGF